MSPKNAAPKEFSVTDKIRVGGASPLLVIAGPCQLESRDHALMIAEQLAKIALKQSINLIFKSSFDKANRTSLSGKRGIGIDEGLHILADVRAESGLAVITDVHSADQVETVAAVVDVLQTPAFLCRQTDLLLAVGRSNKPINVKKGQFLHPSDMQFVAEKIASTGNKRILLCERGASFGYRDLVVDMRSLIIMRELGFPVVFDATHSVQSMGGTNGRSSGSREFVAPLVRAAAAVGVDGIFIECHENPDQAPSDGPSMVPLSALSAIIESACAIRHATKE